MTTEEKRLEIKLFCNEQTSCTMCPLQHATFCDYHTEDNAPEEVVNEWYNSILDYTLEGSIPEKVIDTTDNVNHPSHYETGKVECIDAMIETQGVEAVKNFCICNAFKYLWRHNNKNQVEDIKKAIWYLNKYIELESGSQ